jgi:hypothetical protein
MLKSSYPTDKKLKTKELSTGKEMFVDVCPACWNSKIGRAFITSRLARIGLAPANSDDMLNGIYNKNLLHLKGCKNKNIFTNLL